MFLVLGVRHHSESHLVFSEVSALLKRVPAHKSGKGEKGGLLGSKKGQRSNVCMCAALGGEELALGRQRAPSNGFLGLDLC